MDRNALRNFRQNQEGLDVPVNDVRQRKVGRVWSTTQRLVLDATVGSAGTLGRCKGEGGGVSAAAFFR